MIKKLIKKKLTWYLLFLMAFLVCFFIIFGLIDVCRFSKGKPPIFIVKSDVLNDGGTKIYYGIGYQMIEWKKIDDTELQKVQYLIGREFHFLFWQIDPKNGPKIELGKETNGKKEIHE